jgi:hypothetical protein
MSSPVHHPDDLDAALRYAPPWARKANSPGAASPGDPAAESPPISPEEDEYEPSFDGDRAMLALQQQLSLDPDEEPEPPVRIDDRPPLDRIALRLCAVAGIAALVAWVTISLPVNISLPIKFSLPIKPHIEAIVHAAVASALTAKPVKLVHIQTATAPPPVVSTARAVLPAIPAPVAEAAPTATQETSAAVPTAPTGVPVQTAEASPTAMPETSAVPAATPEPAEAAPAADPPQPAAKSAIKPATLAPDEIAVLVKRGKDFLANGDISSARLLLRRAAEAGNGEAALALGSTFDPVVIARLGAMGVKPDVVKARQWYEKAAALGSNTASEQIAKLAEASR